MIDATLGPRRKSSLLWGVVGGLAFLVLVQGYELTAGVRIGIAPKAGVALGVAAGATALSHATQRRLPDGNERT